MSDGIFPALPPSSQIAGRYTVDRELARGGVGAVYAAVDEVSSRTIALKRLIAADGRAGARLQELFQREYQTLRQLRHPSIIEVYDYGIDATGAYYTMELLDGTDLRGLAPLPVADACRHLRDVASSLALLHARRLLHRDISPSNVRIAGNGRAKLLDFGALTTFGVSSHIVGTPPAVPPEALRRLELDQRADLYGLGALAYWVLTGRHAYPARGFEQLEARWRAGPPPPPSAHQGDIPAELDDLVLALLSHDVLARPRSAAEVIERLTGVADLPPEPSDEVSLNYLVDPPVVGRDAELAQVRRTVERLCAGRSGALLVSGAEGVGKTRLLSEAALAAQLAGATVASVDAQMHPGPYGAMAALLRSLFVDLPEAAAQAAHPHAAWLSRIVPDALDAASLEPEQLPRDRGEHQVRMQEALSGFFAALSATEPLAIVVDNAHAADESTMASLSYVVQRESAGKLALVLSLREGEQPAAPIQIGSLRRSQPGVTLRPLSRDAVAQLVEGLFGAAPNGARLAAWLFERTGGNPTHCLVLAARLLETGSIEYREGAWVLPAEPPAELADVQLGDLHEQQLAGLSASARGLAEALSIERAAVELERCLALAHAPGDAVLLVLDELVAHGVLVRADDRYRFTHAALREHLIAGLDDARRQALHLRAADFALRGDQDDPLVQIDAGWHLLRGGQELRGAHLMEEASRRLVVTIEGLRFAAPALEAALAVYKREKQSPWVMLPVLEALTSAGWYVHHRYAARYGERTLELARELSGIALAHRLSGVLGERRALRVGLFVAAVRHAVQKKQIRHRRYLKFEGVFAPLVGTVGILVGVAANTLDGAEASRVLERARMMRAFEPGHVLSVMYDYARYFTLTTQGRFGAAEPIALSVLEWFRSPAASEVLGEEGARALSGGIMTGIAQFNAFRDDADVEQWAQQLEALGLSFYAMMGTQTRFSYHTLRGRPRQAQRYREQLELHAVQGGTTWQSSIIVPILSAAAHARAGDVVGLRQAVEALERHAHEIPPLGRYAMVYRGYRSLLRGRAAEGRAQLERVLGEVGNHAWPEWVFALTAYARCLIAEGELGRAREAIERLHASIDPRDEPYTYGSLDAHMVLAELAVAEGALDRAAQLYDGLLERFAGTGSALTLCRLHEARARVALFEDDHEAYLRHAQEHQRIASGAEHPVLVARARRLQREASKALSSLRPSVRIAGPGPSTRSSDVLSLLETTAHEDRAATALRLAVERSRASGGWLYLRRGRDMRLACRQPFDLEVPELLGDDVEQLVTQASSAIESEAERTMTVGIDESEDLTMELGELHTQLLWGAGGVVGVMVLRRGQDTALAPLGEGMLWAIARACV